MKIMKINLVVFLMIFYGKVSASMIGFQQGLPSDSTKTPPLNNIAVFIDENESYNLPVGVFSVGQYVQSDMNDLQATIKQSIAALTRSADANNDTNLRIILVIRSLIHEYTNKASYLFGCVAYCIADQNDTIIKQEQFYVRAEGHLTAGLVRKSFFKKTTERIINGLLIFFDGTNQIPLVKGVYDDFDEAVLTMPKVMTSYLGQVAHISTTFVGTTAWEFVQKKDQLDWNMYLHK